MSFSFLPCLVFILSHSVVAQAAFSPVKPSVQRLSPLEWSATHEARADFDGLAVKASLEVAEQTFEVPEILANRLQTLVPLAPPVHEKTFRLILELAANPDLREVYELRPETLSVDGTLRQGFVSKPGIHHDYTFAVLPMADGSLKAIYSREAPAARGEFALNPTI